MHVWVVIAAYNEADSLGETLRAVLRSGPYDVVVVDDGSSDGTYEASVACPVWVLRHPINCGQGAALRTGIGFALSRGADVIVTFDADGQHDPSDIARLAEAIVDGRTDVALGSRVLGRAIGLPQGRRLLLAAARLFTRITSGLAVTDPHNGLRAFSRTAAQRIRIRQDRMAHASEIISELRRLQLRWCEMPSTIRYTAATLAKGQRSWGAFRIVGDLIAGRVIR